MKKKRLTGGERKQREETILNSLVRVDGAGEDPAVRALQQMPEASNSEGLEIALALQKLIRGQDSLLENDTRFSTELSRLRERMDAMDRQAEKWEADRQQFVEDMVRKADKLRLSEEGQERVRAQAGIDLAEATRQARVSMAMDRKAFDEFLAKEPLVGVVSPGKVITVNEGGQPSARLMPEEVRVKHRVFVFPPGRLVEVPKSVSEILASRHRSEEETAERQAALSNNMESGKLEQKMKEIDAKYKTYGSLRAAEQASAT